MPINRWMDKEDIHTQACAYAHVYVCTHARAHVHTHTHTGILFSHEKEWTFAICNNMDGLGGHYAKWNKLKRES